MDRAKLERFGRIVRKRRLGLGMTQDQVTLAGGPSDKRQTKIEHGTPPAASLTTLAKLDQALRWEPGSAAAALNGGTPTPIEGQTLTADDIDRRVALALALERAGVTKTAARGAPRGENGVLTDDVIDSLIDLLNSLPPAKHA
ncbi:hypothetical protein [Rhodococcus sp. ACT016]|uniref:hypothetical protein n=1 Tax=Rhodococcus sp. ACT016 TaxID=3134808 RepID=UPI003D295BC9